MKKKIKENKTKKSSMKKDLVKEKKPSPPCILIVDDDVDSIIPVASLFQKFGCNTICVTDFNEAVKSISSCEPDIIILDWVLDDKNGGDVINRSIKNLEKFKSSIDKIPHLNPKIITYSGKNKEEILLPQSRMFDYVEHWEKPLNYKQIVNKMSRILS